MSARARLVALRDGDDTMLDAVYDRILKPAFNADELETLPEMRESLGTERALGLCTLDDDGAPLGCVVAYAFARSQALLIGYVAARPDSRGQGVGGWLLDEALRQWRQAGRHTLIVGEVEDPRHHPVVEDVDPERRVTFYARRGVQVIAGPYFQPRLHADADPVFDMLLCVLLLDPSGGSPTSMPAQRIVRFLEEYFAGSAQGSVPGGEAESSWLIEWYRNRDSVALQPIELYAKLDIPRVPRGPHVSG